MQRTLCLERASERVKRLAHARQCSGTCATRQCAGLCLFPTGQSGDQEEPFHSGGSCGVCVLLPSHIQPATKREAQCSDTLATCPLARVNRITSVYRHSPKRTGVEQERQMGRSWVEDTIMWAEWGSGLFTRRLCKSRVNVLWISKQPPKMEVKSGWDGKICVWHEEMGECLQVPPRNVMQLVIFHFSCSVE